MKISKLLPALIFIIGAGVFVYTACPSVYVGDTGEIVAAADSLGIAHPPGYPLYTTLGYFFTKLPLAMLAHRVNLLAAFLFALSGAAFFVLLRKVTKEGFSNVLAFSATLALLFSGTLWSQAVMAKGGIYGLNLLFILLCAQLVLKAVKLQDKRSLYLAAFFSGLALANHHTFLAVAALNIFVVFVWRRKLFFEAFIPAAFFLLLGAAYNLYLPIRASFGPEMNWGNPASVQGMFDVLTRYQYGSLAKEAGSLGFYFLQVGTFFASFFKQFTPWLLIPVLLGAWQLYKNEKRLMFYFSALFLVFSFYMVYLGSPKLTQNDLEVVEVFYIPAYMSAAVFLYFGLNALAGLLKARPVPVILSLVFLLPLFSNFHLNNRRENYIAHDYGINILKTPPKNSLLFASQDNEVFILAYFKKVEKVRPDITVYEDLGCVFENIYGADMLRVDMKQHEKKRYDAQMNIIKESNRLVYFLRTSSMFKWQAGKEKLEGMTFTSGEPSGKDWFKAYSFRGLEDPSIYKEYLVRDIIAQYYFTMAERELNRKDEKKAFEYFDKARVIGEDIPWVSNNIGIILQGKGLIDLAIENYRKSIAANPKSAIARYNLGLTLAKKNLLAEAEAEYKEAIRIKPDYSDAVNNLGNLYLRLNRFNEAKTLLLKGVELNPSSTAYYNLGVVYNETMEYDNAIKAFNNSIALNPMNYEAYNNKAFSYYYKKDLAKAIENCEMALKINPNFSEGRINLERLKALKR